MLVGGRVEERMDAGREGGRNTELINNRISLSDAVNS